MLRSLLREPLVHFLLLGAALFLLDAWLRPAAAPAANTEIVVSEARIRSLAQNFRRTWQRPPTQEELDGLVEGHGFAIEHLLAHMGLDQAVEFLPRGRALPRAAEVLRQVADAGLADHDLGRPGGAGRRTQPRVDCEQRGAEQQELHERLPCQRSQHRQHG